jgi:acetyltransferase-like isoleucine patch superfamily enzyme
MRRDARPYWIYRLNLRYHHSYAGRRVVPHFDQLGPDWRMANPWAIKLFGAGIEAGASLHVVASNDAMVRLTCWAPPGGAAKLTFGDACLIAPGTRFMAGERITIGSGCMFGHASTITDCDWHGVYDRTDVHGKTKPVTLGDNVWIGDGAFVGKGVTIGENSIIGARAVVTKDVPANSIAVGNPAAVIRTIDPTEITRTRIDMFADAAGVDRYFDTAYRDTLRGNTSWGWLRSLIAPRKTD